MRRADLIRTTLGLTLALFMSSVVTGCGCGAEQTVVDEPVVASSEAEDNIVDTGYTVNAVDKDYIAMLTADTSIMGEVDTDDIVTGVTKDSYVTVVGTVDFNGVPVDYYLVETDDNLQGYLEGRYLDFNVDLEIDYSDDLVEVEGGDGDSETDETEETQPNDTAVQPIDPITSCDPVVRYTNTSSNIRAHYSKDGELLDTVGINTQLTVTGTVSDWSRVEHNGMVCFIKSSLLSDSETAVEQASSDSGVSSGGSGTSDSASTAGQTGGGNTGGGGAAYGDPFPGGSTIGDLSVGGTTGNEPIGFGGAY